MHHRLLFCILLMAGANLFAQGEEATALLVKVRPHFDGQTLSLEDKAFTHPEQNLSIETLRFYLSNFKLSLDGKEVWTEPQGYHLVDAAHPSSYQIALAIPADLTYDHLSFQLGTDSLANVSGAMEGDLDPTKGMYWAWNSGYINFKLEGSHPDCPTRNQAFQFHLGGYMPPHQTVQTISLPVESNEGINIEFNAASLLSRLDLRQEHTIMSPGAAGTSLAKVVASLFQIDAKQ